VSDARYNFAMCSSVLCAVLGAGAGAEHCQAKPVGPAGEVRPGEEGV
jgi:hypothetical protein